MRVNIALKMILIGKFKKTVANYMNSEYYSVSSVIILFNTSASYLFILDRIHDKLYRSKHTRHSVR